jgi:hypothetical protein
MDGAFESAAKCAGESQFVVHEFSASYSANRLGVRYCFDAIFQGLAGSFLRLESSLDSDLILKAGKLRDVDTLRL